MHTAENAGDRAKRRDLGTTRSRSSRYFEGCFEVSKLLQEFRWVRETPPTAERDRRIHDARVALTDVLTYETP